MSYPIHLSEEALREETEAYTYYEEKSEGLGERFLLEVEVILYKIADNPTFYSYIDETKTMRDRALEKFPFVIIYELKADPIIVYHIHHTKNELK